VVKLIVSSSQSLSLTHLIGISALESTLVCVQVLELQQADLSQGSHSVMGRLAGDDQLFGRAKNARWVGWSAGSARRFRSMSPPHHAGSAHPGPAHVAHLYQLHLL
jgi:hypothetical protein